MLLRDHCYSADKYRIVEIKKVFNWCWNDRRENNTLKQLQEPHINRDQPHCNQQHHHNFLQNGLKTKMSLLLRLTL